MPVIEKSEKAWYVYEIMLSLGQNPDEYSNQDLEALYDAASGFSQVTKERVQTALTSLLKLRALVKQN